MRRRPGRLHPDVSILCPVPGLIVIGLDIVRHIFDFVKFEGMSRTMRGLRLGPFTALALVFLMGWRQPALRWIHGTRLDRKWRVC
jgi:hypothetical protein